MTSDTFTFEQLERAYDAAEYLRTIFDIVPGEVMPTSDGGKYISYETRQDMLFYNIPNGLYETMGSMTGPDGRPYLPAYVLSQVEIADMMKEVKKVPGYDFSKPASPQSGKMLRTLRDFNSVNNYACEALAGIAFLKDRDVFTQPQAVLSFGSVWCYEYSRGLGGNADTQATFNRAFAISDEAPFDVIAGDSDAYSIVSVPDNFFPAIIQNIAAREIAQTLPEARPEFRLVRREKYIMNNGLMIVLNTACPVNLRNELTEKLTWYLPPYLPLVIVENL